MSIATRERLCAFGITALIGTGAVLLASYRAAPKVEQVTRPEPLPSVSRIQQRLNELEPQNPLRVDGKLGPATQAKWDRVFIRESAKAAFRAANQ